MIFFLKWGCLLLVGLIAPISLPAGGAFRNKSEIIRPDKSRPVLSGDCCQLRASPSLKAPILRTMQFGTPLNILRLWETSDGKRWAHVKVSSFESSSASKRGWINV